jgi:2'-phosphotransferase
MSVSEISYVNGYQHAVNVCRRPRVQMANPRLKDLTLARLQELVEKDAKGRYKLLNEPDAEAGTDEVDGWWIRANQGHSMQVRPYSIKRCGTITYVQVKLDYEPLTDAKAVPMAIHGTYRNVWGAICASTRVSVA